MINDNVLVALLILCTATWRLSSLLAYELGPWDIFAKIRSLLGVRYDELNRMYGANVVAQGIICVWCNSVWIAAMLVIAYALFSTIVLWVLLPFAVSALAIVIDNIVYDSYKEK